MSEQVLNDITSYTDFLRESGIAVSLCLFDRVFSRYSLVFMQYEVHTPMVCAYLKSNPKTRRLCPDNKARLRNKSPKKMYYGCCIAGVEEYVVPIYSGEKVVACVNVSGYRGKLKASEKQKKLISKFCDSGFERLYDLLSTDIPNEEKIRTITKPYEYMFDALYKICLKYPKQESPSEKLYYASLDYIYKNYMYEISVFDVANAVNYSESYLRHIFKAMSGKTIGTFINDVRLSNAKLLLENTDFTITRIASDCGFCDGNYFSVLFGKKYGISPKRYSKIKRENKR